MNHPPTYVRTFSLHKVRENCHFLDHPPTPMSLRNIKMAPNMRPEKGRKCYLLVVLLWSIHPKLMYGSKHAGQVQFSADWSGIWVSLKLKKTHYFVFCCGQTFVPSIGSIVSFQLYGQTGSFFALLEISAILLKYLSYF